MKLSRVQICNFRSIRDVTIRFEPSCRVLVGINEAGKTNILRALAMLSPQETPKADDVRVQHPDEEVAQEAYVRFVFSLDREERLDIYEDLRQHVIALDKEPLAHAGDTRMTLAQLCDAMTEVLYHVDLVRAEKTFKYWKFPENRMLTDDWFVPNKSCPDSIKIECPDKAVRALKSALLVHKSTVQEAHLAHLSPASIEIVHTALAKAAVAYAQKNLPKGIFWSHSDNHLIPGRLPLDGFTNNPKTYLPLKHAFSLAGIEDIASAVETAKKRSNGMRNLLDRVAKKATRHIREVWPEYKGISVDLRENGPSIDTSISDVHNLYDFARRSDGFKRFISFLLMVSAPRSLSDFRNII